MAVYKSCPECGGCGFGCSDDCERCEGSGLVSAGAPVASTSECRLCVERGGRTWEGSDPNCAFTSGEFDDDNWNCATLNALRTIAEGDDWPEPAEWGEQRGALWSNDERAALIAHEGEFVVLGWYKHRGRTQIALLISDDGYRTLTLADAERFLASLPVQEGEK